MSLKSIGLDEKLYNYLLDVSLREADVLRRLREETALRENASMQISPSRASSWRCWSS